MFDNRLFETAKSKEKDEIFVIKFDFGHLLKSILNSCVIPLRKQILSVKNAGSSEKKIKWKAETIAMSMN